MFEKKRKEYLVQIRNSLSLLYFICLAGSINASRTRATNAFVQPTIKNTL